jgi:hypothetical protein
MTVKQEKGSETMHIFVPVPVLAHKWQMKTGI